MPGVPVVVYAAFRPDDGELLLACRRHAVARWRSKAWTMRWWATWSSGLSLTAERRRALADAPRILRLTEPLQRAAWDVLVGEVERPIRTTELARRLEVSREHLSRQFGAGGAPNLKRVIDLTRIACAAQLLANPGYAIPTVVADPPLRVPQPPERHRPPDRQCAHQRTRRARAEGGAGGVRQGEYAE